MHVLPNTRRGQGVESRENGGGRGTGGRRRKIGRWDLGGGKQEKYDCINKNNATIMLNLLQSKKGYREEANQKERQKLGKQGIY